MKRVGVVLVMLALAVPVLAGNLDVASSGPMHLGQPIGSSSRSITVYDGFNYGQYGYTCTSGATANDVGDDLGMTAGGTLDEVSFTVWNSMSSTSPLPNALASADLQVTFYNGVLDANNVMNYSYAGGFNITNQPLGLAASYFTKLTVNNLASLNINLTSNIIASLKITNLVGGSTKAGQIMINNPPTIGTSNNYFFKNGQLGWWFGGTPYANFAWGIKVVPEPAGMILLGLAGLLIRRR